MFPSSVRIVGRFCFDGCTSLTSIVFEPSTDAVELGRNVFGNCERITTVTLPLNLPEIPEECFDNCESLVNIPIPNTVKVLGRWAFNGCTSLTAIDLRNNRLLLIPGGCFEDCTALTDISFPNTVQEIATAALKDCRCLTTIDFPQSCVAFGWECLMDCTSLDSITIRATSKDVRIDNDFLTGCTSLTTIHCRPWIWSKLLHSMKGDSTFFTKFISGTFTPLASMNIYSWYGSQLIEAVNDQPNSMYHILREFQHQIFDADNNNNNKTKEEETIDIKKARQL